MGATGGAEGEGLPLVNIINFGFRLTSAQGPGGQPRDFPGPTVAAT